jgi:hypothetical protein
VLLTRPPLAARRQPVRLACIRRAASVRPEPGSNSPDEPASPSAILLVRWNHPPAAPSEEKTAEEPVPERPKAPRILTGVIVVSFLLTTLLLLRCGWSGATEAHKNRRFTRRKVKLGSATCVVSSFSSPCLWSLVPLRSIFPAEPSETGFCSQVISQPALVLYSIALPLSRGLPLEIHTNFLRVPGRFGGAERDPIAGRSHKRLGHYT